MVDDVAGLGCLGARHFRGSPSRADRFRGHPALGGADMAAPRRLAADCHCRDRGAAGSMALAG